MRVKLFSNFRYLLPLCGLLVSLAVVAADTAPEPEPLPSPREGGKSVSVEVDSREWPVEPVPDRVLAPGDQEGASTSHLSPANQSQVGVGFQIRFGKGAKESGNERTSEIDSQQKSGQVGAQKPKRHSKPAK